MRKIVILILCYMFLCFLIPIIFINSKIEIRVEELEKVNTIRLLLTDRDEVVTMSFDDYLTGVLVGEVPVSYEVEALKAQAVVARTYSLYKLKYSNSAHENSDMCDNINHCQAYQSKEYAYQAWEDGTENEKWEKLQQAVKETKNEVITYQGNLINAFFHAHSGGKTEDAKFIWGREEIPYLKSVESKEDYLFEDSKTFSKEEFIQIMKNKYPDYDGTIDKITIEIKTYTDSDRVEDIWIGNIQMHGTDVRTLFGLRSTNFKIIQDEKNVSFTTIGYGHGVGMSQEGANKMAREGKKYEEIIKHYYTGVEIESLEK